MALASLIRLLSLFPARLALLCLTLWPIAVPAPCAADDEPAWNAVIAGHEATPAGMVAVDKKRQQIFLFERRSPLQLKSTYICTTGQAPGDKMIRGDLKTPEGVYFVVQHLTSGLDFTMYGNEAYTLNYPNPVDRLRNKTGYGIWIHGRGEPIAPLQTQGCVAMNNPDLTVLGGALPLGTPVVLTASFSQASQVDSSREKTVRTLVDRVQGWGDAWGSRSPKMFAYYDPDAYSSTTESFGAFKAQKERLFKMLPWIKISIKDIQVLEGPGYWVTWFHQEYAAPNLSTKGVRRLYWEESNGELRIVGMEWAPGMTTGTLLASAEPAIPAIETAPHTEEQDDRSPAVSPKSAAMPESVPQAVSPAVLAGLKLPPPIPAQGLNAEPTPSAEGREPAPSAERSVSTPAEPPPAPAVETPPADVAPRSLPAGVTVAAVTPKTAAAEDASAEVRRTVEAWRAAWEKGRLNDYMEFYAAGAVQGDRSSAAAIRSQKEELWKRRAPAKVELSDISVSVSGGRARVTMRQKYSETGGDGDTGKKVLTFERRNNSWRIVQEDWRPAR